MSISNPMGKMKFTDCLRTILYQTHGEAESETYAYYQKNCSFMLKVDASAINHNPHYYHIHSAIWTFESLCQAHKDISLFEVIPNQSGDEVIALTWPHFFGKRQEFYENEGRRFNSRKPMSNLCSSVNFMDYCVKDRKESMFANDFAMNQFAIKVDGIYRRMRRENYLLTETTTVKEFCRDIVDFLYPAMSAHEQSFIWKILRDQGTAGY